MNGKSKALVEYNPLQQMKSDLKVDEVRIPITPDLIFIDYPALIVLKENSSFDLLTVKNITKESIELGRKFNVETVVNNKPLKEILESDYKIKVLKERKV